MLEETEENYHMVKKTKEINGLIRQCKGRKTEGHHTLSNNIHKTPVSIQEKRETSLHSERKLQDSRHTDNYNCAILKAINEPDIFWGAIKIINEKRSYHNKVKNPFQNKTVLQNNTDFQGEDAGAFQDFQVIQRTASQAEEGTAQGVHRIDSRAEERKVQNAQRTASWAEERTVQGVQRTASWVEERTDQGVQRTASRAEERTVQGVQRTASGAEARTVQSVKRRPPTAENLHASKYAAEQSPEKLDLMKKVEKRALKLPLWQRRRLKKNPPPLCGAIPPEPEYIAKVGDLVAVSVKTSDDEYNWILGEVIHYNTNRDHYEIDDFDKSDEYRKMHIVRKSQVIPLPLKRANPETNPEALFQKGTTVLALYPSTTCFYRATVQKPPSNPSDGYEVSFKDNSYDERYGPVTTVLQLYVVSYKQGRKSCDEDVFYHKFKKKNSTSFSLYNR